MDADTGGAAGVIAFADSDGEFVISDLAAGSHTLLLDEKTLADDLELVSASLQVEVKAGEEVAGLEFLIKKRERPVEILEFP